MNVVQQNERDGTAFWAGCLLSVFLSPLVGAVPLCCFDPSDIRYRTFYLRGIATAMVIDAVCIVIVSILLVQTCDTEADGWADFVASDCNKVYQRLLPIAFVCFFFGIMIIRRTQRVVTGWSTANSGRMAAVTVVDRSGVPHVVLFPHGSIPQAATGRAEFEPTPSNAPFSRVETPGTYFTDPLYHPLDPENLPAYSIGDYNPNTEIKPVNAAENEANPQASSSASKPVLVSSCEHGTDRNEGSGSGPVQAAKTLSPPTRHLSIESLALKLNIPKLLNVSEGVPGVLELPYSELRDRYGITGEEFLKIKAHRKELEKEKNPETY